MEKKKFLVFLFLTFTIFCFSAQPQKLSLLVVQLDPKSSINHLQHLISYQFTDEKYVSKDTILSVPMFRKDVRGSYVRFNMGTNKIYRNRYIVTGIGNIIDVKNKKLLLDQKDQFIKFSGDSIVFYTNDIFKGKYYSVYNLKNETYSKIESYTYKAITGGNIEVDYSEKPYRIWLYDINDKRDLLVADAGDMEIKGKNQNGVPFFWLNENSFLYAKSSSQSNKTSIYKINTDKTQELIGELDLLQDFSNTGFYVDDEGSVIFSSSTARFKIDVANKNISKILFTPVGNKFYAELDENPQYGRKIKDEEKEIGKYFCNYNNIKTTDKMLALSYEMVIFNERYAQGIMLWNRHTSTWTKFDTPDISSVVGWIKVE